MSNSNSNSSEALVKSEYGHQHDERPAPSSNIIGAQPEGLRYRGSNPQFEVNKATTATLMPHRPPPIYKSPVPAPSGPPPPHVLSTSGPLAACGPPPAHSGGGPSALPPPGFRGTFPPPQSQKSPNRNWRSSGTASTFPKKSSNHNQRGASTASGSLTSISEEISELDEEEEEEEEEESDSESGYETEETMSTVDPSSTDHMPSPGPGSPWLRGVSTTGGSVTTVMNPNNEAANLFNVPIEGTTAKGFLQKGRTWRYNDTNVEDYYILFQSSHTLIPTVMGVILFASVTAIPVTLIRYAERDALPVHIMNLLLGCAALVVAVVNYVLCWHRSGGKRLRHQGSKSSPPSASRKTSTGSPEPAGAGAPSISPISTFGDKEAEVIKTAKINEWCVVAMLLICVAYLVLAYARGEAYRDILRAKNGEELYNKMRIHKFFFVGSQHYFASFVQLIPLLVVQLRVFFAVPVMVLAVVALFIGRTSTATDPVPALYSFICIQIALTAVLVMCLLTKEWFQRKRFEAWVSTRVSVYNLRDRRTEIDRVILNVLPQSAFRELANHGAIVSRREQCSVSVAQVKDFLQWSCSVLPVAAVYMIDTLFSKFDSVVRARYGAEKLKTTGDSYLVGWGLQEEEQSVLPCHDPTPLVKMGIWQSRFSNKLASMLEANQHLKLPFHLTIGIHTGPCIGGVFGSQRLWYDCAGEAVDVAQSLSRQCPVAVGLLLSSETRRVCAVAAAQRESPQMVPASTPRRNDTSSHSRNSNDARDLVMHAFGRDSYSCRLSCGDREMDEQVNVVEDTIRASLKAPITATPAAVFALALGKFGSTEGLSNDSLFAVGGNSSTSEDGSQNHRAAFLRLCVSRQRADKVHRVANASTAGYGSMSNDDASSYARQEYKRLRIDDDGAVFNSQQRVSQLKKQFRLKDESNSGWQDFRFAASTGLEEQYQQHMEAMDPFTLLLRTIVIEVVVCLILVTVAVEQSATTEGTVMIVSAGALAGILYTMRDVTHYLGSSSSVGGGGQPIKEVSSPFFEVTCAFGIGLLITCGVARMEDCAINSHAFIVFAGVVPFLFFSVRRVNWKLGTAVLGVYTFFILFWLISTSDVWVLPAVMLPSILFANGFANYLWEQDQRSYFQNLMMAAVVLGAAENELLLQRAALRTLIPDCVIGPVSERCFKGNTNSIAHQLEEAVLVAIRAPPLPTLADMENNTQASLTTSFTGRSFGGRLGDGSFRFSASRNQSGTDLAANLDTIPRYLKVLVKLMEQRAQVLENLVGTSGHLELVNSIGDTILLGGPLQKPKKKKKKHGGRHGRHGRAWAAEEQYAPQVELPPHASAASSSMMPEETLNETLNEPKAGAQSITGGKSRRRVDPDLTDPFGMKIHDPAPMRRDNEAALRECCWDVVDLASALQQEGSGSRGLSVSQKWTVVMTVGPAFACVIGQHRPSFDILGSGARAVHGLLSAAPNGSCVMTSYFKSLLYDADQPQSTNLRRVMFDSRRLGRSQRWRCRGVGVLRVSPLLKQQDVYSRDGGEVTDSEDHENGELGFVEEEEVDIC